MQTDTLRSALALVAVLLAAGLARAAVPPEALVLLDTSREMSALPAGGEASCAPADRRDPGAGAYVPDTALSLVKEALIGTRRGAPRWCVSLSAAERALHVLGADGAEAHHRPMCCADAACGTWAPCGNDHGQGPEADDAAPPGGWAADGLLFTPGVRFALLTTDAHPGAGAGPEGHFSFGNDGLQVNGQAVDLGARGPGPHAGALVAGAGDDDASVAAAQAEVARALGRVVTHGGAPLAALLHDALTHWAAVRQADPAAACRRRVVVLITRGIETAYFADHPPQFPYRALEATATDLLRAGVGLHVVVLGPPAGPGAVRMAELARRVEGVQLHTAVDGPGVRTALEAVLRDVRRGRTGRITPRVITPAPADQCPDVGPFPCVRPPEAVVQWRLHAFTDIEPGGTYGRVHAESLTCARNAAGEVPIGPRFDATLRFEDTLPGGTRRLWSAATPGPVLGAPAALFDDLGRPRDAAAVQALTGLADLLNAERADGLPAGAPVGQRAAGLRLAGFVGERGLIGGQRQLGATEVGDLAVLSPPVLGLDAPSALAYEAAHARRPTLAAVGAADGALHVFRVRDGAEVVSVAPRATWRRLPGEVPLGGPLVAVDLLPCRSTGAGDAACPADPAAWTFSAWLFGTAGRAGDGVLGLPLPTPLARDTARPLAAADAAGLWEVELGGSLATSRPLPITVAVGERRVAALLLGCGDDPDPARRLRADAAAPGRCVVVLEATTGRLLRRFTDPTADRPFTGSPVAWPAGQAERAWLGDAAGRLWRIDLRAADPAAWQLGLASPGPAEPLGIMDEKPAITQQPDGTLSLVFHSGEGPGGFGQVTSLVERPDGNGFRTEVGWRLPLGPGEVATGAPVTRDGLVYFTTRQVKPRVGACPEVLGRLYGVHAWRTRALANLPPFSAEGGRRLDVVPALPRVAGEPALSVVLPPGRTAHGLAFARQPACLPGEAATTEVVLDLADERDGTGGLGLPEGRLEVVEADQVRTLPLVGELRLRSQGVELAVCLDCDPRGDQVRRGAQPDAAPNRVLYWGDVFQY